MIILDTSVWIEFLKANIAFIGKIKNLLEERKILAVECIFAELLQGVKNERESRLILSYWDHLPKADETGLLIEAGLFSGKNKLLDKGVGLIDSLIYMQAVRTTSTIWTLDKKLIKILSPKFIYTPEIIAPL